MKGTCVTRLERARKEKKGASVTPSEAAAIFSPLQTEWEREGESCLDVAERQKRREEREVEGGL